MVRYLLLNRNTRQLALRKSSDFLRTHVRVPRDALHWFVLSTWEYRRLAISVYGARRGYPRIKHALERHWRRYVRRINIRDTPFIAFKIISLAVSYYSRLFFNHCSGANILYCALVTILPMIGNRGKSPRRHGILMVTHAL